MSLRDALHDRPSGWKKCTNEKIALFLLPFPISLQTCLKVITAPKRCLQLVKLESSTNYTVQRHHNRPEKYRSPYPLIWMLQQDSRQTDRQARGLVSKRLWCCVGGDVKHKILDLSTELIR